MGRDEMRAGDADREVVADQLRAALDEGRLDLHEYDDRLRQVYAARTYGELRPLVHDLPAASVAVPGPVSVPGVIEATDRQLTLRWLAEVWGTWASVVGITMAVWAVSCLGSGELLYFWPMWVAGPWGVVLLWSTIAGLATGAPRKQAEDKVRKAQAKQAKRERKALEAEQAAQSGEVPPAGGKKPAQGGKSAKAPATDGELPAITANRDGETAPVWNPGPESGREVRGETVRDRTPNSGA